MVRRAAAQNLASFARIVEADLVPGEFLPLFQHLTQDGEQNDTTAHTLDVTHTDHKDASYTSLQQCFV